jgi:hypothetical protein
MADAMMLFLRGLFTGVLAVVLTWIVILIVDQWRLRAEAAARGITGLAAVAGGWTFLLHKPFVLLLLTAAFGSGLWLGVRR